VLLHPLSPVPRRVRRSGWWWGSVFDVTAVVLGVAGFIAATWAVFLGLVQTFHLQRSTTRWEQIVARRFYAVAAVIGAGVPLVGLVLSLWVRRKALVIYFTVLLALGTAFAGLVAVDAERAREPEPAERGTHVCQELSGSDNRCPGG
jgi:hypothetical protein